MDSGVINQFSGKYRFLSNFYPSPITINGVEYPTIEHAYQCGKALNVEAHNKILSSRTPGEAKRRARKVAKRHDFDIKKLKLMEVLVKEKFRQNPELARRLMDTYPAELVEGNSWGDRFWGVYRGRGQNNLGRILISVRSELRERYEVL